MSQAADSTDTSSAAYAPYNWWGDEEQEEPAQEGHAPAGSLGTSRAEFVAHSLLKRTGTLLDGRTLKECAYWGRDDIQTAPVDELLTMGDPGAYPSYPNIGKNSHALRYNDHTGRLNWGESTWVAIADRPTSEFMTVVEEAVRNIDGEDLTPRQEREIMAAARAKKVHADDLHDSEIMELVVRWIDNPGLLSDAS